MVGKLLSVNVAVPAALSHRGESISTGIFKKSVAGGARLLALGLEGDFQADPRYHGGPEKAVYLYPFEHYAHWRRVLGLEQMLPGFFGENFTTEELLEDEVRLGDVFDVATARVEVTRPRTPCFKLGLKVGSPRFLRTFQESGRLGFYLRVVREGFVQAGDTLERVRTDPSSPAVSRIAGRNGTA